MSASNEPGQEQEPEDETKRKFREALAAKQRRRGEDHLRGTDDHPHPHGPVGGKRVFRRKSG